MKYVYYVVYQYDNSDHTHGTSFISVEMNAELRAVEQVEHVAENVRVERGHAAVVIVNWQLLRVVSAQDLAQPVRI